MRLSGVVVVAKQLIYRHILGALVEHEAGLTNAALVAAVQGKHYISANSIKSNLRKFSVAGWVQLRSKRWCATAAGKRAYANHYVLAAALLGIEKVELDKQMAVVALKPKLPELVQPVVKPPVLQEITRFPREWMPKRPVEVAWLYRRRLAA